MIRSLLIAALSVYVALGDENARLEFDSNRRLARNSILYQDTEYCRDKIKRQYEQNNPYADSRNFVPMSSSMLQSFVDSNSLDGDTNCAAVCVDKGLAEELLPYPLPYYVYFEKLSSQKGSDKISELNDWTEKCKAAEVGFVSYWPNEAHVYWLDTKNKRHSMGILKNGERYTLWQNTFLGHVFEVYDRNTDELILRHTVTNNAHVVVGQSYQIDTINKSIESSFDFNSVNEKVKQAMSHEWTRCNRVKRTYTPLGFSKGRLPKDVWGSISAYQYNNKDNAFVEEWSSGGKGYFVNWWEVPAYMIGIPWNLKRYWQGRLRDMVAEWIGGKVEIENTDIYGIRRYEDGARLLTHVDRESTHAVSMIINVDQVEMREPWMVEIYDFAGRLHEIPMEPGDIVYYESARCLHGRMKPLKGASYSNLFTHYRPLNDPKWFTRTNPPDTPKPVLDLDSCGTVDGVIDCDGVKLPHLSPAGEVVQGPNDLYSYWERIGKAEEKLHSVGPQEGEL